MPIFGGDETLRYRGPAFQLECPNCRTESVWHLSSYDADLTVNFVKVATLQSQYVATCPSCNAFADVRRNELDAIRAFDAAATPSEREAVAERRQEASAAMLQRLCIPNPATELDDENLLLQHGVSVGEVEALGSFNSRLRERAVLAVAKAHDAETARILLDVVRKWEPTKRGSLVEAAMADGDGALLPLAEGLTTDPNSGVAGKARKAAKKLRKKR